MTTASKEYCCLKNGCILKDALAEIADKARYLDRRPDIEQPEVRGLIHRIVEVFDTFEIGEPKKFDYDKAIFILRQAYGEQGKKDQDGEKYRNPLDNPAVKKLEARVEPSQA